jgi:hypothetical protein
MSDPLAGLVLLAHAAATLFMVGLIWFVQVVHYPLLARVGPAEAVGYEQAHTRRTAWVVGPAMLLEAGTGVLLARVRPAGVSDLQVGFGLALLAVVWASTRFVQVPCHDRLSRAFDPPTHGRLVATNWVRTAAWTLRGLLALWMINDSLQGGAR